ncbi:MAG TPA: hypothetical protein ENG34_00850 [Candidatus Aenigmarchaeota archaeon]|nr:hypothetical protein [Candidatus Aenigmarchaeota archaeon]
MVVGKLVVPSPKDVEVKIFLDEEECTLKEYCPNHTVNIKTRLKNVGFGNVSGNLTVSIFNPSWIELSREVWFNIDLPVGKEKNFTTNYTVRDVDEKGIYTIVSNFTYDSQVNSSTCNFQVIKGLGDLVVNPSFIKLRVRAAESNSTLLNVWTEHSCERATTTFNISDIPLKDWTSFNPFQLDLSPGIANSTNITVSVPYSAPLGLQRGTIKVRAQGISEVKEENVTLEVNVTPPLFYLNVSVPANKKKVCQGDEVYALVNLTKNYPGWVNISLSYRIVSGNTILEEKNESLYVNESLVRIPVLEAPSQVGTFSFLTILKYDQVKINDSDTFEVITCEVVERKKPSAPKPIIVYVQPKYLNLTLSTTLLSVLAGQETSFYANVFNPTAEAVKGVWLSVTGIPKDWLSIVPDKVDLEANESTRFLVRIKVPATASSGIYGLRIKAKDEIESNEESLTLVVGKSLKEICDLLLSRIEELKKEAERALLAGECVNVSRSDELHSSALEALNNGMEEYERNDFEEASYWLEYAVKSEESAIAHVNVVLETEIFAVNTSSFLIPPFYEARSELALAQSYVRERNYEEVCEPIEKLRKYISIGLIFWPFLFISIALIVYGLIRLYLWKRGREVPRIMEEVRKRLGMERSSESAS